MTQAGIERSALVAATKLDVDPEARTVEDDPLALPAGANVREVARAVHSELGASVPGARGWGTSARSPGQRVGHEHVGAEGDVIELVTGPEALR